LVNDSEVGIADFCANGRTSWQQVSSQRQCSESYNGSDAVDSDGTTCATDEGLAFELGDAVDKQAFVIGCGGEAMDCYRACICAVKDDVNLLVGIYGFAKAQICFAIKTAMDGGDGHSDVLLAANEYFFYVRVVNEQS
jgi:hypothetical protein